jgi:hypothetical protein
MRHPEKGNPFIMSSCRYFYWGWAEDGAEDVTLQLHFRRTRQVIKTPSCRAQTEPNTTLALPRPLLAGSLRNNMLLGLLSCVLRIFSSPTMSVDPFYQFLSSPATMTTTGFLSLYRTLILLSESSAP